MANRGLFTLTQVAEVLVFFAPPKSLSNHYRNQRSPACRNLVEGPREVLYKWQRTCAYEANVNSSGGLLLGGWFYTHGDKLPAVMISSSSDLFLCFPLSTFSTPSHQHDWEAQIESWMKHSTKADNGNPTLLLDYPREQKGLQQFWGSLDVFHITSYNS